MIALKALPPPADRQPVRRALLSVSDKTGLADFARRLHALGVELVSTGGTAAALRAEGLPVRDVAELTGQAELLGGRVKTLHPAVHAGLLARRNDPEDLSELDDAGFVPLDLVVVNLYPFREATAVPGVTDALAAENVDIGGPTMLRAAAKNFAHVAAVVNPADYAAVAAELEASEGTLGLATRRRLAGGAFAHTADYDTAIAAYFEGASDETPATEEPLAPEPDAIRSALRHPPSVLRYGENPHQAAALYGEAGRFFRVLHGKALSYNNLLDLSAALRLVDEFSGGPPTAAILKHTNPCGVGQAATLAEAFARAFATDRVSPFGGVVVLNRPLDRATAEAIDAFFTELVIAPGFDAGVLDLLQQKANRRLIAHLRPAREDRAPDVRSAVGGLLVQATDPPLPPAADARAEWTVATERAPTDAEWADLDFAWRVAKHVKSNAIVYARGGATLGIGAGQMSRVDASELAVAKAKKEGHDLAGSAVASDAFFPFADGLAAAAAAGATAAIQPGGSVRDAEVIAEADARALAMVFTGKRHFRH